ncbi:hypothetical protein ACE4Z7_24670, partial [Salmonella enterica]|uniref:hypothetical protein n=1 Tax=Salmonella enterica TaxID=28901 RepID=UPI003D26A9B1
MPDGSVDSSYADNGVLIDTFVHSTQDQLSAMALQPDGKIVAVGSTDTFVTFSMALARYDSTG